MIGEAKLIDIGSGLAPEGDGWVVVTVHAGRSTCSSVRTAGRRGYGAEVAAGTSDPAEAYAGYRACNGAVGHALGFEAYWILQTAPA